MSYRVYVERSDDIFITCPHCVSWCMVDVGRAILAGTTGFECAVAKSSINGLVGTGFTSWNWLQPNISI